MRLVADSGLWSTGSFAAPTPLLLVLEVSGAVLSWPVDDETASPAMTFTDTRRADWLWRVLGESGHSMMAAAVEGQPPEGARSIDLAGVDLQPGALDTVRRLAMGHWLRRWWPASHRDGIAALDASLLAAEVALLTTEAQDFFTDETFDSDVAGLLAPHASALESLVREGDPRIVELVRAAVEMADDVGVAMVEPSPTPARRADYALAAGPDLPRSGSGAIAQGTASLDWGRVPPGIFDAAEQTVSWRVDADDEATNVTVRVELTGGGSADGIPVRLRSGALGGANVFDTEGRARFPLVGSGRQSVTELAAWNHDWRPTTVTVGADVDDFEESAATRDRIRDIARARLAAPAGDAFLAEILAAESDY